jgi:hypothetical protein
MGIGMFVYGLQNSKKGRHMVITLFSDTSGE